MNTTARFTHRSIRIEVWQGNDSEGRLGYLPWFWQPLGERGERLRIHAQGLQPSATMAAAKAMAKSTVDRILDWYPVR